MANEKISLIKFRHVLPIVEMLKVDGPDELYALFQEIGIPANIFEQQDGYVPEAVMARLLNELGKRIGPKRFVMFFARACKNVYVPYFLHVLGQQPTLRMALIAYGDFLTNQEASNVRCSIQQMPLSTWWVKERVGDYTGFHFFESADIILMIELVKALADENWLPDHIALQSKDSDLLRLYLQKKRTRIFVQRWGTGISLPESILDRPLQQVRDDLLDAPNKQFHGPVNYRESLEFVLLPHFRLGRVSLSQAASILGVSQRTLQRRLAEEKINYREFVDEMIKQQAQMMLANPDDSITHISSVLGFNNASHFSRSFKRLTGLSPRSYRQILLSKY